MYFAFEGGHWESVEWQNSIVQPKYEHTIQQIPVLVRFVLYGRSERTNCKFPKNTLAFFSWRVPCFRECFSVRKVVLKLEKNEYLNRKLTNVITISKVNKLIINYKVNKYIIIMYKSISALRIRELFVWCDVFLRFGTERDDEPVWGGLKGSVPQRHSDQQHDAGLFSGYSLISGVVGF